MHTPCIRLAKDLEEKLTREARYINRNRSEVTRAALDYYLTHRERERFLQKIESAAHAMADDPDDGRCTAEGFLPADNDALKLADSYAPGTDT